MFKKPSVLKKGDTVCTVSSSWGGAGDADLRFRYEIGKMRLEEFVSNEIFAIGDTVSIEDGPLKGFFGTIKELNSAAQKAKISTTMFGRETDVEVEYIQIKKVDATLPEPSVDEE